MSLIDKRKQMAKPFYEVRNPTRVSLDPEPFAVDAVLEQIEWEAQKEETRKRIADLNANRRPVVLPRWAVLLGALAFCGTFWGFAIAWVWPWLNRILSRFP